MVLAFYKVKKQSLKLETFKYDGNTNNLQQVFDIHTSEGKTFCFKCEA
jgi:hypothetical protein